ncbi:Zinc finger BED domain-containing-like protein [Daphnia magna]|uniref:Zinc finger BED domain-containing-like protein n=2 Tax=Daphnia magna TaxID=35525 RepID=A0A164J7C3_9CRUS|nr:Zinc finger BED domain-containing-like protein [Daphnia magna]
MDNDIFRSAIYLDPRIKVILSTDERVKAKAYLVNLWQAVHQMRLDRNSNNNSFPHGHAESFIGPLDKFESAMRERENFMVSPAFTIENKRIDHLLENFEGHPRINSTENLLEWWYNARTDMPELFILAEIVHGVPVTQVSVERCFSSLKFVLSAYRNNLTPSILEDILLIRCNEKFEK